MELLPTQVNWKKLLRPRIYTCEFVRKKAEETIILQKCYMLRISGSIGNPALCSTEVRERFKTSNQGYFFFGTVLTEITVCCTSNLHTMRNGFV